MPLLTTMSARSSETSETFSASSEISPTSEAIEKSSSRIQAESPTEHENNLPKNSVKFNGTPKNLIRTREMLFGLEEQIRQLTEEVARMCKERTQEKQQDELLNEVSAHKLAAMSFKQDSENRYRARQDEHETKLAKLREEQIRIQENLVEKRSV